jgi:hypothetical protein
MDHFFFTLCMNNECCGSPLDKSEFKNLFQGCANIRMIKQIANLEEKMATHGVWSEEYVTPYVKGGISKQHRLTDYNKTMTMGVYFPIACLFVRLVCDLKMPKDDLLFLTENQKLLFKNPEMPMDGPNGCVMKRYVGAYELDDETLGYDFV